MRIPQCRAGERRPQGLDCHQGVGFGGRSQWWSRPRAAEISKAALMTHNSLSILLSKHRVLPRAVPAMYPDLELRERRVDRDQASYSEGREDNHVGPKLD